MSLSPPSATALDKTALSSLLALQQNHAPRVRAQKSSERIAKLRRIAAYLERTENKAALIKALEEDFRKPEVETLLSELGVVLSHIRYISKHLKGWMEPTKLPFQPALIGMRNYIYKEPKGCALIISPWNYPFNLTLVPLVYAIAAGCTAVVKPSELSPATTEFIRRMIDERFPPEEIKVVTGEGDTSAYLTTLPFDHIFFTGSPAIGKKVMAAAAKNLTSVTLELGGKSPAIIDQGINLKKSARNSVWGKFFNAGQTCIAPDYLLVHERMAADYVDSLKRAITSFYGEDSKASDSLARIINDRHFDRIKNLLDDAVAKGATVAHGGQTDRSVRYIAPTILTGVTEDMEVMREEIFGPLWPVMTYQSLDEAVEIINRRPKALAFYIQSDNRKTIKKLLAGTSSGGALVNEYLLGGGSASVPFGGVNNSGIGKSFGYHGFIEFTNERPVMERRFLDLSMAYPPYTDKVKGLVRKIYGWL
ncbi:MAG: aldehyde dehydrogenase family protein [Bacteroidota bacterium]